MMKMMRNLIGGLVCVLLLCICGASYSNIVTIDFSGTVTAADAGNALGLAVNDVVTGSATYDDSLLTGIGSEVIELGTGGNGFGGKLTMHMGLVTYVESDDADYNTGYPKLGFDSGILSGFDFFASNNFSSFLADFFYSDAQGDVVGVWDTFGAPHTAVPEPSTLVLFAISIIGVLGLTYLTYHRRKRAA